MNLFFYLQTAIIFFVLCFIKTQHSVKRKPVKTGEKNTGTITFRFRQVLLRIEVH